MRQFTRIANGIFNRGGSGKSDAGVVVDGVDVGGEGGVLAGVYEEA